MPWHHVIPKHEWKKRFGNLKGVNAPDNQVNLYYHQHIQVHEFCYKINGLEFDRLAVLRMSGQIGNEEIRKGLGRQVGLLNKGRIQSEEHKRKTGLVHIGKIVSEETRQRMRDRVSPKNIKEISVLH